MVAHYSAYTSLCQPTSNKRIIQGFTLQVTSLSKTCFAPCESRVHSATACRAARKSPQQGAGEEGGSLENAHLSCSSLNVQGFTLQVTSLSKTCFAPCESRVHSATACRAARKSPQLTHASHLCNERLANLLRTKSTRAESKDPNCAGTRRTQAHADRPRAPA